MIAFINTYSKLPERFFEKVNPAIFSDPSLIKFNHELARDLGIALGNITDEELAAIFSGQKILPGSEPIAQAYAGFQFGNPVPQLGDGRAHLLGEVNGFDLQLKGSGETRFSRRGDGRSALGPVLREYLVSEAMHALGVPTTRALCAVTTGEEVYRQSGPEPGGVFTRVAASHLRVGTFQYFAFRQDLEAIKILLNYTLKRHYSHIDLNADEQTKAISFLKELTLRQADLIAKWSSFGFIHGVMNTDNFSLAGITIDYGPCAFMDEFKFDKVFSSIDQNGRYAFFNQVPIAKWNILRLAECLLPLVDKDQDKAINIIEAELAPLFETFEVKRMQAFSRKLGVDNYQDRDEKLVMRFLNYLQDEKLDFTQAFYNLDKLYYDSSDFYPTTDGLRNFLHEWKTRVTALPNLKQVNPYIIPRNHLIQKVIDNAYAGDFDLFHQMLSVITHPFDDTQDELFAKAPEPAEKVYQTFCGT